MDFDLLVGGSGNLQLCVKHDSMPWSTRDGGAELETNHALISWITCTFKNANRILYCDDVDRSASSCPGSLSPPSSLMPTKLDAPIKFATTLSSDNCLGNAGRRELPFRMGPTADLVRRHLATQHAQSHHRCPGYRREEIFLGTNEQSSAVISYSTPSPHEIPLPDDGYLQCSRGKPDNGLRLTMKCTPCDLWHHRHCPCVTYLCPMSNCEQVYPTVKLLRGQSSRLKALPDMPLRYPFQTGKKGAVWVNVPEFTAARFSGRFDLT
ncbi:hypothetical protein DFH09DRAFT_1181383 [Mycena vulgaris]|nr:hypothetical protein DFH09DRAFT_1181383 [Mycena vulgaris]